jgi:hypothetical protein
VVSAPTGSVLARLALAVRRAVRYEWSHGRLWPRASQSGTCSFEVGARAKRMPAEKQCADDFVPGARPVPEPPIRLSRDADGVFWTARQHGSYRRKECLPSQTATWSSSLGVRVRYMPPEDQRDIVYGREDLVLLAALSADASFWRRSALGRIYLGPNMAGSGQKDRRGPYVRSVWKLGRIFAAFYSKRPTL